LLLQALSQARRARLEIRRARARLRGMSGEEARRLQILLDTVDNALEAVTLRIETMLASGVYTRELAGLPLEVTRRLSSMGGLPPAIAEILSSVEDSLQALVAQAPEAPALEPARVDSVEAEAARILREAEKAARRKLEEANA